MKILTDNCFSIGKTHQVCEDYALNSKEISIICDGCSSSTNTDIGARLLAHKFLGYYNEALELVRTSGEGEKYKGKPFIDFDVSHIDNLATHSIGQCLESIKPFELQLNCCDATMLVAYPTNDAINVAMFGDGHILARKKSGMLDCMMVSYKDSMPPYLSYRCDLDRNKLFRSHIHAKSPIRTLGRWIIGLNPSLQTFSVDTTEDDNIVTFMSYPQSEYDLVVVSSDGIDTFHHVKENKPADKLQVYRDIMNFKVMSPSFLKRRIKRMLEDYGKQGIQSLDDISFGAIFIE